VGAVVGIAAPPEHWLLHTPFWSHQHVHPWSHNWACAKAAVRQRRKKRAKNSISGLALMAHSSLIGIYLPSATFQRSATSS